MLNFYPDVSHTTIGRWSDLNYVPEVTDLEYGMDFRHPRYRREVFLRFYEFHCKYHLHPGLVYLLMPFLYKKYNWDAEQRLWFAYLNGHTQNPLTSKIIFNHFPDLSTLDISALTTWFNAEWKRLAFDMDRVKNKRNFIKAVTEYKHHCKDSQEEYFSTFMGTSDPYQNFRKAWEEVRKNFYSFGRLSSFSYLEYLRAMRFNIDCDQLFLDDMSGSKSHRNGLAKVLGRDDLDWHDSNTTRFDGKYTPEMLSWLEKEAAELLKEAKERMKDKPYFHDVSYFTLESTFCTYKSWYRPNRRYPNVYTDMLYNRIKKAESDWPENDFSEFWDARKENLPAHLLLEFNPTDIGVKAEKQNHFRETGCPVMMDEWDPVFKNRYNDRIYGRVND
jgi:hypothetical protein